ncbi:MAG: hypothetical protein HN826_14130 [Methylococcales bacterium]|jgi:hypothetical protein|nr:hypothetical protein [Methylococcales bacterium]
MSACKSTGSGTGAAPASANSSNSKISFNTENVSTKEDSDKNNIKPIAIKTAKFVTTPPALADLKHKLAIIYSKTSEQNFWTPKSYAQLFMSVQSQVMMSGLPYDLLNEDDLLDIDKISQYKTLIFPLFSHVKNSQVDQIAENIKQAIDQYNIGIITAGNFITNIETGLSRSGDAYNYMKDLLGIARIDGAGPVDIQINVSDVTHPVFINEYFDNEVILSYQQNFTDYFMPTGAYPSEVIATQQIGNSQVENALITVINKGRHVHFSTVQVMADANLLWPVIQWSVWGEKPPATLHMGREKALFVSRNDMDQSMFNEEVATVEFPLLDQLKIWKDQYNFVGSYYINIGDNAVEGEFTDWGISAPLYKQYIALGNEIGSHSYTHPHNTDILTATQVQFEFSDSRNIIEEEIELSDIGTAIPGNPEKLVTALKILPYVDYLSGGYAAKGAGFPNSFGFLNADTDKVYLSPNMSFDFTLIQFQKKTVEQAKQVWSNEFDTLVKHASQPIIHWPWHDYGPFDVFKAGYTLDLFESLIAKAKSYGSEFITGKDLSERIKSFKQSNIEVSKLGKTITAKVYSSSAGKFALNINQSQTIASIDQWYAYNKDTVFLDQDGGIYTIHLGIEKPVTHINKLPSRSQLVSLYGNGEDLKFQLSGEGTVEIITKCSDPSAIKISGAISSYETVSSDKILLNFPQNKHHQETLVDITCQ